MKLKQIRSYELPLHNFFWKLLRKESEGTRAITLTFWCSEKEYEDYLSDKFKFVLANMEKT
jgi:hypothetical protein